MPAITRGIICIVLLMLCLPLVRAQDAPPEPEPEAPPISAESARLLELGKLLVGQNNPAFAMAPEKLTVEQHNAAGEQALRIFRVLVKREPKLAEAWLWLGIALTETLAYTHDTPQGKPACSEAGVNEGIAAFRTAYELDPACEDIIKCYSDALMEYRKDFDTALSLWVQFLAEPDKLTNLQKMVANVQAARACLNKAYFGKEAKDPAEQVKKFYTDAVTYLQQASALFPGARDVKEMQALLQQHKSFILGKNP